MVSNFFLNFQISRFRLKSPGFFNESIHSLMVSQMLGLQFCYKQKMHPKWQHLMPYKRYLSSEKLNKSINQLLNWLHLKVFVRIILSLLKVQHKILLILPKIMSRSCRGKFEIVISPQHSFCRRISTQLLQLVSPLTTHWLIS